MSKIRRAPLGIRSGRLFLRILRGMLGNIAYFLSGFFPRDKNLWLFGAWEGTRYCDNSRYLFEHLLSRRSRGPKAFFWLTHSDSVYEYLRSESAPVLHSREWLAWWRSLRAGFIFITHGRQDVMKSLSRGAVVVNLNHALPIKYMGPDVRSSPYWHPPSLARKLLYKIVDPYWSQDFDYALSASRETARIVSSSMRMPKDRVLPFGFPRFVHLLSPQASQAGKLPPELRRPPGMRRQILYMPTFRDNPSFSHFGHGFDLRKTEDVLSRLEARLLIALHPFDRAKAPESVSRGESARVQSVQPMDVNELLPHIDALITDFSSVMFDYLLLDRPILYTQFEFDDFLERQGGLYFKYDEVTAGPKARTWDEVLSALSDVFSKSPDPYGEARARVRGKIFDDDYANVHERIIRHATDLSR